ncbi:hypothetical protein [Halopiger aswanensis]|uniref:Uncharacterized protein n=1 Tax=Halopiger aswanensis TaxID=148449 RepID=A0A3R7HV86_9EURY|nr:hypothetical protein [Halopiger aswanensis]RKD88125.1 hypothetical protein ATJ93_4441 [Halopiger aswanensis]
MLDAVLHTGSEHPDLLWILVPSFLSFIAGLSLRTYADRLRRWARPDGDTAAD